uniref:Protein PHLOEM PROTEIN 2-LIKE A6 n=1 Tax=Noccaea caerulescens TaxID=107243 RepID=A0A1J3CB64_NOCCA
MLTCFGFGISLDDLRQIFGFLIGKGYIRNLSDNLNNLRTEMENLDATQREVKTTVAREEAQHRQILEAVRLWLDRVEITHIDFEDLLRTSDAHLKELFLCDLCSINVCSSYGYGKKVFLFLEYIRKLNQDGQFKEVAGPALRPEVHIQDVVVSPQGCMVYARDIEITHSEKPENWTWRQIEGAIEVAELKEVYWLDIRGNLNTRSLIPETKYEVVFVVKLQNNALGWEDPVNLSLKLVMRDKSENLMENTVCLDDYISNDWVNIIAGDFVAPPKDAPAKIFFTMYQYDDNIRKTGLVVKGVAIRAVTAN